MHKDTGNPPVSNLEKSHCYDIFDLRTQQILNRALLCYYCPLCILTKLDVMGEWDFTRFESKMDSLLVILWEHMAL